MNPAESRLAPPPIATVKRGRAETRTTGDGGIGSAPSITCARAPASGASVAHAAAAAATATRMDTRPLTPSF
jgi:hypothetical protein